MNREELIKELSNISEDDMILVMSNLISMGKLRNEHIGRAFNIVKREPGVTSIETDNFITLDLMAEKLHLSMAKTKQLFNCKKKKLREGVIGYWIDKNRFPFIDEYPYVGELSDDIFDKPEELEYFASLFTRFNKYCKVGNGFNNTSMGKIRTMFYGYKTKFIVNLIKHGYLTYYNIQVRHHLDGKDEVFYGLSFSINGKEYQFHQQFANKKLGLEIEKAGIISSETVDYFHPEVEEIFDDAIMESYYKLIQYFIIRYVDVAPLYS